jgi:hypothetical protein
MGFVFFLERHTICLEKEYEATALFPFRNHIPA